MNSFRLCYERFCLLLTGFILLAISPVLAAEAPRYTIAVIPLVPPVTTHAKWAPFVERVGRETGLELELKLYETMDKFENDIYHGIPDFVFLHSVQAVAAKRAQNYIPLVRNSKLVSGAFVVRKDSPIKTVQDLEGKTVALVGEKNLCRTLLDHELREELHVSTEVVYSGTAANMLKYVILSKADAGGALDASIDRLPQDLLDQVRVIYNTKKIAPPALVAHPRVPEKVRDSVADAVVRMVSDSEALLIMREILLDSPVRADYERDYGALEKMNIERYFGPVN
ncbi:MAG: phosphate/phosphite/phosphonate ABC transporter substrate-binding protein [Nitrospirota bacterium]|nr:phosphate/phosphite/phosphonate ABC transporter substrate-binding protein [Nitrospirota bacterium]